LDSGLSGEQVYPFAVCNDGRPGYGVAVFGGWADMLATCDFQGSEAIYLRKSCPKTRCVVPTF